MTSFITIQLTAPSANESIPVYKDAVRFEVPEGPTDYVQMCNEALQLLVLGGLVRTEADGLPTDDANLHVGHRGTFGTFRYMMTPREAQAAALRDPFSPPLGLLGSDLKSYQDLAGKEAQGGDNLYGDTISPMDLLWYAVEHDPAFQALRPAIRPIEDAGQWTTAHLRQYQLTIHGGFLAFAADRLIGFDTLHDLGIKPSSEESALLLLTDIALGRISVDAVTDTVPAYRESLRSYPK